LNESYTLEEKWQAIMASGLRTPVMKAIEAVFARAIEARAPLNRPPGKAGLKAEKGYYRLLYLEGELSARAFSDGIRNRDARWASWEKMEKILSQLKDLPELQEEIRSGIAAAMDARQDQDGP